MERIAIVGCRGGGKSRLARVLSAWLGVTPVHLEALYYDKDWKPLDQKTLTSLQRKLVDVPDGSSTGLCPSAEWVRALARGQELGYLLEATTIPAVSAIPSAVTGG